MTSDDFSFTTVSVDGKTIYNITWVNKPMDSRVYDKISRWFKKSTDYGPTDQKKLNAIKDILTRANKEFGTNVTIDQVLSVRNIIIKDKIIKNYSRMNRNIVKISKDYDAGHDIVTLSAIYDFPPLNLLRGIFIHRGFNVAKLYSVFANKSDPSVILKGRDLQQYKIAERNDAESTFNQQKIAKIAADNEINFINFFKSIGINLLTQDDLSESQTKQYGRAVITPDLLFVDEVYINGHRVTWIDYKDYIGTRVHFLFSSNSNQANKYKEKWGDGALCYHRGYVEGLVIPGAMLLDARSLPTSFD
jgi:hypothetical protein